MVKIIVKDVVDNCSDNISGLKILTLVEEALRAGEEVTVSFEGVSYVSTSFVNSAFINLLENFTFNTIKTKLSFVKSTIQINKLIKERFAFESNKTIAVS
ncbi:STAS-like domain-containing protein [Streptococcus orisasini]